MAFIEICD